MTDEVREEELRLEIGGLVVRLAPDARAAARAVAAEVAELVGERRAQGRGTVLGLATGQSPLEVYAELARLVQRSSLSLADTQAFALDEYLGLAPEHPASFGAYLRRHVQEPLGLDPARLHLLRGDVDPAQAQAACTAYEGAIRAAGGIDLQLLGIGRNGHLAFNEPGSPRASRSRPVELAEDTRSANRVELARGEEVPARALTLGIATILDARRLRVLALGAHKASIVRRVLTEPIGPDLPATFLREHPDAELLLDPAAATEILP